MRALLMLPLLLSSALACTVIPIRHPVAPSFSVLVRNEFGPVVGLKLRITHFKSADVEKLSAHEVGAADLSKFEELIAAATTGTDGVAHFDVKSEGDFDLQPDHPAGQLAWIVVQVRSGNKESKVALEWPVSGTMKTRQLRGKISTDLFTSKSQPLVNASLTLHRLMSFESISSTTTDANGGFRIDGVPDGLYFLHLRAAGVVDEDKDSSYLPRGDIVVAVDSRAREGSLLLSVAFGSCGLMYDLESNKAHYKPEACFKGGKPVKCDY